VNVKNRFVGAGVDSDHEHYKWWALSCTSLGMLLVATNSGTLIIALPDLERSLGTSLLELVWVILAYMISSTVPVLTAGRLSDVFGRKSAYVAGFLAFAAASLGGAGFAADGTELILWRVLQGVGGAFLFANAAALVTDAFPREQLGLAMGTNTMVAATGLVLGPVLGGALVAISWHWVFWFNVPLGLAGAVWGSLVLRELAQPDAERGIDFLGILTFVSGLTGLVYGLSRGGISGWDDPLTIAGLVVAGVLLPLFVLVESRVRAPMLAPMALGMLFASPLAGIWADRHGSRMLAALGMLVSAVALAGMTTLQAASPYWQSMIWLGLVGDVQLAQYGGDDGRGAGAVPRRRRRRADDAAEHRGDHLDRLRHGGRHRRGAETGPLRDLLRPRLGPERRPARSLHRQHAHRALGPRRDLAARRRDLAAAPTCGGRPGVQRAVPVLGGENVAPGVGGLRTAEEAIREEIEATP